MGKPVLATRCGGAEMQIEEGINGWLVEPNNAKELAKQIQIISSRKKLETSQHFKTQLISIESHCNSLYSIYQQTIKQQ